MEVAKTIEWDKAAPSKEIAEFLAASERKPDFDSDYSGRMWSLTYDLWNLARKSDDPGTVLIEHVRSIVDAPWAGFSQFDMDWSLSAAQILLGLAPEKVDGVAVLSPPSWQRSRMLGVLHSDEAMAMQQRAIELHEAAVEDLAKTDDPEAQAVIRKTIAVASSAFELTRFHRGVSDNNERHRIKMENAMRALRPFALAFEAHAVYGTNDDEPVTEVPKNLTVFHVRAARHQFMDLVAVDDQVRVAAREAK